MMKVPRKRVKGSRARPQTSRVHKLKDVHYRLWKFYWERSRILPGEQYYEFQIAAARHFGVDRSTISRRLDVLIEHACVAVVKEARRNEVTGLFTSVVIQPTEPPRDDSAFDAIAVSPPARMHADQVTDNTESETTCKSAQVEACSIPLSLNSKSISSRPIDEGVKVTLSYAKTHADQVIEKKPSSPRATMHAARTDIATRLIAAHRKLKEFEDAAANCLKEIGDDSGWTRCAEEQRAVIARLQAEWKESVA